MRTRSRLPVALLAVFAFGIGWMIVMLLRSPGVLLDDELTHALISLNAWRYPEALLDVWGRPGNTLAYMLPMLLGGLAGRRLAAIGMTALTAACAVGMAPRLGVRARWLVALCFFFQPWIAGVGFQSLTQIPFSLALAAGVLAWMRGRWGLAGLCFGLLALIRHEGIVLSGLWLGYALLRREWRSALLAAAPFVLYNAVFLLVFGRLASANLLNAVPTTEYGSGTWLHFVPLFTQGAGPAIVLLFLAGLWPALKQREPPGRLPRGWPLVYLTPYAAWFVLHTVLYRFGLFASGGYGVFLLPLAPAVAVLAARGGEWLFAELERLLQSGFAPQAARRAAIAPAGVMALLIVLGGIGAPPTPLDPLHEAQQQAAGWVRDWQAEGPARAEAPVAAPHVAFWLSYNPWWPSAAEPWWREANSLPPGGLLVWDSKYSPGRGLALDALEGHGWRELARFGAVEAGTAAVILLREDS